MKFLRLREDFVGLHGDSAETSCRLHDDLMGLHGDSVGLHGDSMVTAGDAMGIQGTGLFFLLSSGLWTVVFTCFKTP